MINFLKFCLVVVTVLTGSGCDVVTAATESSFVDTTYSIYPNFQNPLIDSDDDPLYYNDASNILYDLDSFESIYVQYHSCAMIPSTKQQSNDNNNQEEIDENDNWYIGATPISDAQVMFSLYGIKKDSADNSQPPPRRKWFQRRQRHTNCQSHTFINSFYTSAGMVTFINALIANGKLSSSDFDSNNILQQQPTCHVENNYGYGMVCSPTTTTFGSSKFVYNQYSLVTSKYNEDTSGAICATDYLISTTNTMDSMNQLLHANDMQCYEIYNVDRKTGNSNNNDNNDNNDGNAIQILLSNSQSCHTMYDPYTSQYCPDPYHIIQHRDHQLVSAMIYNAKHESKRYQSIQRKGRIIYGSSILLIFAGVLFVITSIVFIVQACQIQQRRRRKRSLWYRRKRRVREANRRLKRRQQHGRDDIMTTTMDDTTTIASCSTTTNMDPDNVTDEQHVHASQTPLNELSTITRKLFLHHSAMSATSEETSSIDIASIGGHYTCFGGGDVIDLPSLCYDEMDDIGHDDDNNHPMIKSNISDESFSISPTSIIETYEVSRMESFTMSNDPLLPGSETGRNCSIDITETTRNVDTSSNDTNLESKGISSIVQPHQPNKSPTTSLMKMYASRRQRLSELRRTNYHQPHQSPLRSEMEYIPPSLESIAVPTDMESTGELNNQPSTGSVDTVPVRNEQSSTVKDLISDDESRLNVSANVSPLVTNVFKETFASSTNVTSDNPPVVAQFNEGNADLDHNQSTKFLHDIVSSVNSTLCTDFSCPALVQCTTEVNDSVIEDDTLNGTNEKSVVADVTAGNFAKQATSTRYVKAIGEALLKQNDDDTTRCRPVAATAQDMSSLDVILDGPVSVHSYLTRRQTRPRISLPEPRAISYQSHRTKDKKPIGLLSYALTRDQHTTAMDINTSESQDIPTNEVYEAFHTTITQNNPKFIRVALVDNTKSTSNNNDLTPHVDDNDDDDDNNNNVISTPNAVTTSDLEDEQYNQTNTSYDDDDVSYMMTYLTEIPLSPQRTK